MASSILSLIFVAPCTVAFWAFHTSSRSLYSRSRPVRPSVVKIEGVAPSCQQALEGSGFVVSAERVMTNAHVVAGTRRLTVQTEGGDSLAAKVVLFDSRTDIAVLDVPGLSAKALQFDDSSAKPGADAIVLGYPEAGPFTSTAVRVRETINLSGPDIYRTNQVLREVYTVRGTIRQGNSGGPMIDPDGDVLGVVFGAFTVTLALVSRPPKTARPSRPARAVRPISSRGPRASWRSCSC